MSRQTQKPADATSEKRTTDIPAPSSETPDKLTILRPARAHVSPEETRARMEAFTKEREEAFVAAIR